jgi:hypothetical protein
MITSRTRALAALAAATIAVATAAACHRTTLPAGPVTAADLTTLDHAGQLLERTCMVRHGFDLFIVPQQPIADLRDFPYGIDDPDWAARHGYGSDLRRQLDGYRTNEPNHRYFESLGPQQQAAAIDALDGTHRGGLTARLPTGAVVAHSDDGCTVEAERRLYGDPLTWYRVSHVSGSLTGIVRQQVLTDPAYIRAVAPWATCMRAAGHPAVDPADARAKGLAAAPSIEIATAVAEARCARSTGLAHVAAELDARYTAAVHSHYRDDLNTQERLRRAALPRARTVVAAAPAGTLPDGA